MSSEEEEEEEEESILSGVHELNNDTWFESFA